MSSRHYISVFTKLESFRGAGERVKKLLKSILTNDENQNNFLVAMHDSQRQDLSSFASRTAVIVIDARQTRTLFTPSRRDANVDHWDELVKLTYSFTYPKGSMFLVIYGDMKSKRLEGHSLIAEEWKNKWHYDDTIAYSLAERGRCITIWDTFNGVQTKRLREFFQTEILHYTFYERQTGNCLMQNRILQRIIQKCICAVRRVSGWQTVLVFGIDEIPKQLSQYFQLNPFITVIIDKESDKFKVITHTTAATDQYAVQRVVNVYLAKLSAEDSQHYHEAPTRLAQKLRLVVDDLTAFRFRSGLPDAANRIVEYIPSQALCLLWNVLAYLSIGPMTYDTLFQVTHCDECFIDIVGANEEGTEAFKSVPLHFNGKVIPVVPEDSTSSDSLLTKLDEYISKTENGRDNDKKHPRAGISAVFHWIQFLFFTVINFICLLFSNPKQFIVDNCHEIFHHPACQKFIKVIEYIAWIIFVISHNIVVYSLVIWQLGKTIMSLFKPNNVPTI